MLPNVNYLAVLFAAIAGIIIPLLWYSRILFGKFHKKRKDNSKKGYVISFIFSLLMAYVLAVIINVFNATSFTGSLKVSFLVWLGFIIPTHIGGMLWKEESFKSFILEALNDLISIALMGIIIVLMH